MEEASIDYIIVGGGSAGCVLANRLSSDAKIRVLLIEAGRDLLPNVIPAEILDSYPMALFYGEKYIWPKLDVIATRSASGAPITRFYEQGRVMGGGSSVNVQAANRGLPRDYDDWHELGANGWAWEDVLPYFRKLENDLDFKGPMHGNDGPIAIRRIRGREMPEFGKAALTAFERMGLPLREDQNADFADGIFPPAFSNQNDRRVSASTAYLDEATRRRPNLSIWPNSHVDRLIIEDRRATGVRVIRNGNARSADAIAVKSANVIITAGALQTPAILMRSGIGPACLLGKLGIQVNIDHRGVGQNLRDHPALTLAQFLPAKLRLKTSFRRANLVAARYSSDLAGCESSDMYFSASGRGGWHALGSRLGLYFLWCNRPHSVGRLRLKTSDPFDNPEIDFNLLSDPRDLARMMSGIRRLADLIAHSALSGSKADVFPATFTPRVRRLSQVSALNKVLAHLLGWTLEAPEAIRRSLIRSFLLHGADFQETLSDDRRLEDYIRRSVFGLWHPVGTCRMGRKDDPLSVVDTDGKVLGADNVFVADASVMPTIPTANTNIPTIMIAEKISESLRQARYRPAPRTQFSH